MITKHSFDEGKREKKKKRKGEKNTSVAIILKSNRITHMILHSKYAI